MPGPTPIPALQRATLSNAPFLEEDMRDFLLIVQQKSEATAMRTLRVVHLLDGEGQQHKNAVGRFFAGGVNAYGERIQMDQDFAWLRTIAAAWLPPELDQSNGWTVKHLPRVPIQHDRHRVRGDWRSCQPRPMQW